MPRNVTPGFQARGSEPPPASGAPPAAAAGTYGGVQPLTRIGRPADLADRLPPPARERLLHLREAASVARAAARAMLDEVETLRLARHEAQGRIRQLTEAEAASRYGSVVYPLDHPSVVAARSELDRLSTEMAAAQEHLDAREHRSRVSGQLVSNNLEAYLRALADDVELTAAPPALAQPRKAESIAVAIDRIRGEVERAKADLLAVKAAPITSQKAREIAHKQIEALAEAGARDVFGLIEHGEAVRWPQRRIGAGTFSETILPDGTRLPVVSRPEAAPDAMAVLAWLHKDALIAAINAEVDVSCDDGNALCDKDRSTRLSTLRANLLQLEREEAGLVESLNGAVLHRADIDPRAALSITGPAPRMD